MKIKPATFPVINMDIEATKQMIHSFKLAVREQAAQCGVKVSFRSRGRGPRKATFAIAGRPYHPLQFNSNDVSLSNPEAKYMHWFAVYTRIKK